MLTVVCRVLTVEANEFTADCKVAKFAAVARLLAVVCSVATAELVARVLT